MGIFLLQGSAPWKGATIGHMFFMLAGICWIILSGIAVYMSLVTSLKPLLYKPWLSLSNQLHRLRPHCFKGQTYVFNIFLSNEAKKYQPIPSTKGMELVDIFIFAKHTQIVLFCKYQKFTKNSYWIMLIIQLECWFWKYYVI